MLASRAAAILGDLDALTEDLAERRGVVRNRGPG
jgi:hypothetical protein